MTTEQFDNHNWKKGCKVVYKDYVILDVIAVDFEDRVVTFREGGVGFCEEIEIVKQDLKTEGKFLDGDAC